MNPVKLIFHLPRLMKLRMAPDIKPKRDKEMPFDSLKLKNQYVVINSPLSITRARRGEIS